jgi:hypothetical protein
MTIGDSKYYCPKHGKDIGVITSTMSIIPGIWCGACWIESIDKTCEKVIEITEEND